MTQLSISALLDSEAAAEIPTLQPNFLQGMQQRPQYRIPVELLTIDVAFNRRQDWGDLGGLAEAINLLGYVPGVLQGFVGGEQQVFLTDGFRRMAALQSLHEQGDALEIQECWITLQDLSGCSNSDQLLGKLLQTQILANEGKRLTMLEQARIFHDLERRGFSRAEISRTAGISISSLSERMRLLDAPAAAIAFAEEHGIAIASILVAIRKALTEQQVLPILQEAHRAAAGQGRSCSREDVELAAQALLVQANGEQLQCVDTDAVVASRILQLYAGGEGLTMAQIQRKLRIAWSTVNRVVAGYRRAHQFDWLQEHGITAAPPPIDYYTNLDWAREVCGLSRQSAAQLLQVSADEIEAVETLQKRPTAQIIQRMVVVYRQWLPGLQSDHLLGISDFRAFLDQLHRSSVQRSAAWA